MRQGVFFFGGGRAEGDPTRPDLLGAKGAGLAEMTLLGLPVPAGFTIATPCCSTFFATGHLSEGLRSEVNAALSRLEAVTSSEFGGKETPLLVSVRSGARVSMPGMMDTILNLGQNGEIVRALALRTESRRFALDTYRRFLAAHASVALGVSREPFARVLEEVRGRVAVSRGVDRTRWNAEELRRQVPDSDIPVDDLQALVSEFRAIIRNASGHDFPDDPREQLWQAIAAVFESWRSPRAVAFRKMHEIAEDEGTACTVQVMVFGNLGETSATGVAFTRDPSTGEKTLYGEWLPNAQGEDVVAGVRTPLPLRSQRRERAEAATRASRAPDESLEACMPETFRELERIGTLLEQHLRDAQDVEFTIENGRLFVLQSRVAKPAARASVRMAVDMASEGLITQEEAVLRVDPGALGPLLLPTLDPTAEKTVLARGLPASPGAATGHVVFDCEDAERSAAQGRPVILVRGETSPEDVQGMRAARGTLTTRGGMTSHAAVVARGLGRPCVAGVSAIAIHYDTASMTISLSDDGGSGMTRVVVKKGDIVTIDGSSGHVYKGSVGTVSAALSGDFGELTSWADRARTMQVRADADTAIDARLARTFGAEGIGLCRTESMFFDDECLTALDDFVSAADAPGRAAALSKMLPQQREAFVGVFREVPGRRVTVRLLEAPIYEVLAARGRRLPEGSGLLAERGCRMALPYPEIYAMQARAIFEAAAQIATEGGEMFPEIAIPLPLASAEIDRVRAIVDAAATAVLGETRTLPYSVGATIGLPRATLVAGELARSAQFLSFDIAESIDQQAIGLLVGQAVAEGKRARSDLQVGVSGQYASDPTSIGFFQKTGFDYVSCRPERLPVARLAAAQSALREQARPKLREPKVRERGTS